jgi:hypothetical protein
MKQILNVLIFVIILFCLSCEKSSEPPCTAVWCSDYADGKRREVVLLNDTNNFWLDNIKTGYMVSKTFRNKDGATFNYLVYNSTDYENVYLNQYKDSNSFCCSRTLLRDYVSTQSYSIVYGPNSIGSIKFWLKRYIDLSVELTTNDSVKVNSKTEKLILIVNSKVYQINPDTSFQSADQIFHNAISLNGLKYDFVFELIDNSVDSTKILPQGFYFSFNKGLVGYYLTNKELWVSL